MRIIWANKDGVQLMINRSTVDAMKKYNRNSSCFFIIMDALL